MIYKQLALSNAIADLGSLQLILGKITDEPEITNAVKLIQEATAKLIEVEKGVSDYLEERR